MTSTIKVNNIQNQCGQNIINENSNTITIGASGDTISLAAGASQTGFGREGSVDWQTTPKTTTFTAVSGEGYFVNSGSALTMNLPAGSAGAIVAVSDYARNFATYNLSVTANGSEKIGGVAASATLNVNGQAATFVYVDSTKGWINVQNAENTEVGAAFLTASGGTETECGDYKIHTFTGPGSFIVGALAPGPSGNPNNLEYLVAAGGGGGAANCIGGAGGAGGFRYISPSIAPLTFPGKPLCGSPVPGNVITATATTYPITVGSGGPGAPNPCGAASPSGVSGNPSTFSTITSAGGGGGGARTPDGYPALTGGSGGGSDYCGTGAAGNTPPTVPPQGQPGGSSSSGSTAYGASGGGGALNAGSGGSPSAGGAGGDGAGIPTAFGANGESCGSYRYYSGGGGGANENPSAASGGKGGGGDGGFGGGSAPMPNRAGQNATINTGGGGGGTCAGGSGPHVGGGGGSGIVIIRYKFQ